MSPTNVLYSLADIVPNNPVWYALGPRFELPLRSPLYPLSFKVSRSVKIGPPHLEDNMFVNSSVTTKIRSYNVPQV
ncbi:hypothetical protein J6590_082996 [Homalodisca vitripennis]|nr:hypothetical protein J6590_082996 [Homalodisca vitripennis]